MRHKLLSTLRALCLIASLMPVTVHLMAQTPATAPQTDPATAAPVTQPAPASPASSASGQPNSAQPATPAQPGRAADGSFTIRRSARLVVLDVVVTDKSGKVVTDLTRDDFHVTEMDQPQTILNFEDAGRHTVPTTLDINSTADLDRLAPQAPVNILLLDEFNTRFEDMAFARYSLKKILEKQPEKLPTPTMLIAVNLTSFSVLVDYTQDKAKLIGALDHHFVAYPWQVHQGGWIAERFSAAFGTLTRVAEAVTGHPGHKNMIWIGRGFPAYNFVNGPVDTENRVNNAVQLCVNELRDARVTLYTVDPAGLTATPGGGYGPAAAFNDPFGGNYQFSKLAVATGGRTFYGRNDVDAEIANGIRDGAAFYSLTYRPGNDSVDPKKFRRIKITLSRPDLTATTREGYYVQQGPARVNPSNPSRRLAFELMAADSSNMVYDGVPLTLTPDPANPDAFNIHVNGKGLVWTMATDTEARHADVVVIASTFDKKNKQLKQIARSIKVPATADVPPTGPLMRDVNFHFLLDHDPKAVRARFVVRVSATGRIGTADAPMNGATLPPPK
ncbi:VWA domain-containing protein [Terriglobus roseus]|uniref:VWFA-related domain-containing protein n=1 Tax=Terriglobus roseus TaxID=392734 RepID=A0A1H4P624_9BACT|nr:VWA domain-containing protein [Terriglobus roseus]SEC02648.1 VWFA-related domain-containing protein [Terriglobus roseus]